MAPEGKLTDLRSSSSIGIRSLTRSDDAGLRPLSAAGLSRRPVAAGSLSSWPSAAWGSSSEVQLGFGGSSGSTSLPRPSSSGDVRPKPTQFMNGLAPSTKVFNRKARQIEANNNELFSKSVSGSRASLRRTSADRPYFGGDDGGKDMLTLEETLRSFASLEGAIQDLRNTMTGKGSEDCVVSEDDLKRADERRKRDERERKLRDKARDLRDPKRRVAAILDHCREAGQAQHGLIPNKSLIPMQVHTSLHTNGAERIEMVNVLALQGRCKGMSQGAANYSAVKAVAEGEEKHRKWFEAMQLPVETAPGPGSSPSRTGHHGAQCSAASSKKGRDAKSLVLAANHRRQQAEQERGRRNLAKIRNQWQNESDLSGGLCCNRSVQVALHEAQAAALAAGIEVNEYIKLNEKARRIATKSSLGTPSSKAQEAVLKNLLVQKLEKLGKKTLEGSA
ncbi:unnamed protein product, partial [Polarella glacialis]